MRTLLIALVCLVCAGVGLGQSNTEPTLKPRPNTVEDLQPGTDNEKVPPDAPVITIQGACEKPAANNSSPSDCKTVITRAEFEKVLSVVQPMPKAAQKQFASRYVMVLLLADKAHEMGLDHGPSFDEQMYLQRLQVLAKMAGEEMQKEAAKVADSEIEDYYNQHAADFRTISYDKLYIPKQKQDSSQKPNDPDAQKKRDASEAEMKDEAEKLRTRAAAGEDFAKLQQEAYDFAGLKLKASNTRVDKVKKTALYTGDAAIFDLKKGDVSQVFTDPQGFMIYKVEDFQDQSLPDSHDEISRTLQNQKLKGLSDTVQKSATEKATYDNAYFGTPAAPTLRIPGETPAAPKNQAPPPPGKQ